MKKSTKYSSILFTLLFTFNINIFAEVPNLTVLIGHKAYDLNYSNNPDNLKEILNELKNSPSEIYIKNKDKWYDNFSNKEISKTIIPKVIYKDVNGKISTYGENDGEKMYLAIKTVKFVSPNKLLLHFNEELKEDSSIEKGNYTVNGQPLQVNDKVILEPDKKTVSIHLEKSVDLMSENTIVVSKELTGLNGISLKNNYSTKALLDINNDNTPIKDLNVSKTTSKDESNSISTYVPFNSNDNQGSSNKLNGKSIALIEDGRLKMLINSILGKDRASDAPITIEEMESLTEINGDSLDILPLELGKDTNRGITSIRGLEHAKNLKSLDLSENRIVDLGPLKNLSELEYLEVDRNYICDLTPLQNLKKLNHLNIYNNAGIIDLNPISNLTNLKWIDMHYCSRRSAKVDVEPLGKLVNLEFLSIDDNFSDDISFTKHLVNLKTFSCNNNHVTDLAYVEDLAVLSFMDWSGEVFFNMFGQRLKEPINKELPSEETTFSIANPVTNIDKYTKKISSCFEEMIPNLTYNKNDNISAKYNYDTKEIEITVKANTSQEVFKEHFEVTLEYGMYGLTLELNITQEAAPKAVQPVTTTSGITMKF